MYFCISKLNFFILIFNFCKLIYNCACFYFHSFRAYFHMIAMMGINTQYFQSGFEYHAEFSANTTMKFDARINMQEKNLKIETLPCHQEVELAAARYRRAFFILLVLCYWFWVPCYKITSIQLLVKGCHTSAVTQSLVLSFLHQERRVEWNQKVLLVCHLSPPQEWSLCYFKEHGRSRFWKEIPNFPQRRNTKYLWPGVNRRIIKTS